MNYSTAPYQPNGPFNGDMSIKFTAGNGAGYVYQWIPFSRRVLF